MCQTLQKCRGWILDIRPSGEVICFLASLCGHRALIPVIFESISDIPVKKVSALTPSMDPTSPSGGRSHGNNQIPCRDTWAPRISSDAELLIFSVLRFSLTLPSIPHFVRADLLSLVNFTIKPFPPTGHPTRHILCFLVYYLKAPRNGLFNVFNQINVSGRFFVNRCIARSQGVNLVARNPALRQRAQGVKHRFLAPQLGNANEYIFISLVLCRQ